MSEKAHERSRDTEERILRAGIAEFARLGYGDASTARIVEAAGCSVRMLYHYYASKRGLYRSALERVYADLRNAESALQIDESDPRAGLERFIVFTFDYMIEHPEFPQMLRVENLNEGLVVREMPSVYETAQPLMHRLERLVAKGMAEGLFTRRLAPEHLYLDILGLSFVHISNQHTASMMLGIDFRSPQFLEARRNEAIRLVMAGLGCATGGSGLAA